MNASQPTSSVSDNGPTDDSFQQPPRGVAHILREIGPGLIIAASIVGSGELIMTTKLGADVGFTLLWFIILGCLIKVFVQIELGRYAISHGHTTLEALDSVPGPRLMRGWMVYVWLAMYIATFFQLAGMVGAIADVLQIAGVTWKTTTCAYLVTISCAILLAVGRYRVIERLSTTMVALFTLFTILAVGALAWTDYAITGSSLASGLTFDLPDRFVTAFAAFGIIGVGASELIYYPYWCLEKGYARHIGPNDGSPAWGRRARGWMRVLRVDAWVSMVVYTVATIAFYLLGAAVLHGKQLTVDDETLIPSLSQMYSESFGRLGLIVFVVGAFIVLYSTVFIATASNGRLMADALCMFGLPIDRRSARYGKLVLLSSTLLPLLYLVLFLFVSKPLTLVFVGAIAQGLMLPLLCMAALYFHHAHMETQLRSHWLGTIMLWIAAILMTAAGGFQIYNEIRDRMQKDSAASDSRLELRDANPDLPKIVPAE